MWGDRYIPMSYYDSLAEARTTLQEKSLTSLEMQTDLLDWLRTTTSKDSYAAFMTNYGYTKVQEDASRRVMGEWLHGIVKDCAEVASTFYVSSDMCEMVKLAAAELDVSEGLIPGDLPAEKGFLVYDRPFLVSGPAGGLHASEVNEGEEIMISAILWERGDIGQVDEHLVGEDRFEPTKARQTAPGVKYWLFMTPHDSAVAINQNMKRQFEAKARELGIDLVEPIIYVNQDGSEVEWVDESQIRREAGPVCIYDFSGWSFEQAWAEIPYGDERENGWSDEDGIFLTHPIVNQVRRQLLATWRMLGQQIVRIMPNTPPRTLRRRAGRLMPETGDILIIRLRKEYNLREQLVSMGEEGSIGELWSHRWIVRGHWRRPKNTPLDHPKTIWVAPYVKGPDHLPLVVKEKIFSLEN